MVDILNEMLGDKRCAFRFELVTRDRNNDVLENLHIKIIPVFSTFISSCIFNLTNQFYDWLERFCKDRWNVTLSYNNTRSVIWTEEGWDINEENE
jgi:hypothetical protein